jgi:hypothetical protein
VAAIRHEEAAMKKRAAMTFAGGLVAALLAGAVALSLGLAGADTAGTGSSGTERVQPRVRTVERTITVHKKAKAGSAPVVRTIAASAPASNAVSAAPAIAFDDHDDEDDEFDDEGWEHEDEDHDDEGEEHEEHDEDEADDD